MTMMLTLSKAEMLRIWRQSAGLEHLNSECTLTRFDGIDIDAIIGRRMRQWYLALLDEGRPELAGRPSEAAALLSVEDGRVTADAAVRRIVSLRLSSWERPAEVADVEGLAGRIRLQANPYSAAGCASPLAWRDSGGCVRVAPCDGSDIVVEAQAYVDPGEDLYMLDERALSTIPTELII